MIQGVLSSTLMGYLLRTTAIVSGGLALTLSGAVHFGLLNEKSWDISAGAQEPATGVVSDSSPEASTAGNPKASRPGFDRESVLNDTQQRIADLFAVPEDLRPRVGFWFDIYSKYDSNKKVIHHALYPWIIYKVIDVTDIVNAEKPKIKWLRVEKAERMVRAEADRVRATLRSIAKSKARRSLSQDEETVLSALMGLGGDPVKQAKIAAHEVRIQTGQRDFFSEGLRVSPRYMGQMEKIFISHKLPVELTRLPFVESSFNKHATSKVGAAGIWQIMPGTGRKFLIVNDRIDERLSPFKATEAAAKLLKENHLILHRSWPLAITAWNHGPGGVRKAIKAAGSKELGKIVGQYRSRAFDFASSNFYSEFLAALHTERYQDMIFGELEKLPAAELSVVKVSKPIRPSAVMRASGLSAADFLILHPELKRAVKADSYLPTGFRLHLPETSRNDVQRLFAKGDVKRTQPNHDDILDLDVAFSEL